MRRSGACLREVTLASDSVRIASQAEGETFADFLTYVLAAFLLSWSDKLRVRTAAPFAPQPGTPPMYARARIEELRCSGPE